MIRRLRRISISLRLTVWFGSLFFVGWILFGVSMWMNLRHTLANERRLTLTRRIDRLQELLMKDRSSTAQDLYQDYADFAHATGNGLAEVFRSDGTLAYPSPSAAAAAFSWPGLHPGHPDLFVTVASGGQWYRVMARPFSLTGQPLVLMAAAPEAGNMLVMQSFLRGLLGFLPLLLLTSSAGGYWVSRRALRPVDRIAATARSISIRNISERVPVSNTGDELERLAETCNAMLGRLESSVNQIKRFTADASHELRGPLSYTRTVAEITLRNPAVDPVSRDALKDIVAEVVKASAMLEEMLTLARADATPVCQPRTQVNLTSIVRDVCSMAAPVAAQKGLSLSVEQTATHAPVRGDTAALKRLLWILLDNAIKYSKSNGSIAVRVSADAENATVAVSDDGIGIAAADLPFIFERFYRADPSRGMVEGNGLGLAIAKWIAETHEAKLTAESEELRSTCFTVKFPCISAAASI